MNKIILSALLLTIFTGCKVYESPSMALAKEMCSCLFVANQGEKYCRKVTAESRTFSRYTIYRSEKMVEAEGFNFRSRAKIRKNKRFGCRLYSFEQIKDPEGFDPFNQND